MDKPKRSYYLPAKLIAAFDRECERMGLVKERVVAAAVLYFLEADAEPRQHMLEDLDAFIHGTRRTPRRP